VSIFNQAAVDNEYVKMRWKEPYVSTGLNRKGFGITRKGIYSGFQISPGGLSNRDIIVGPGFVSGQINAALGPGYVSGNFDESSGYSIAVHQGTNGFQTAVTIPPGPNSETHLDATGLEGQRVYIVLDVSYVIGQETSSFMQLVDGVHIDNDPSLIVVGHVDVPSSAGTPLVQGDFGFDDTSYPRLTPFANALQGGLMPPDIFTKLDDFFPWDDLIFGAVSQVDPFGVTLTPSQKVRAGKRVYTYIASTISSKFPRDASGDYNGGVNNDQLTTIGFSSGSIGGAHGVSGNDSFATPSVSGTPNSFQLATISISPIDNVFVNYGSIYGTKADAIKDDNLPSVAAANMEALTVILETNGSGDITTLTNIASLIDRRPFLNLGGGAGGDPLAVKENGSLIDGDVKEIDFVGATVEQTAVGKTKVTVLQTIDGVTIVRGLRLGESFGTPNAAYPQLKNIITIDNTNNKLTFNQGGSDLPLTIANGDYPYPFTNLASDIKTKMDAATGSGVFTIVSDEEKFKISIDSGSFSLKASETNSILPKLGYGVVDLTAAAFHRAATRPIGMTVEPLLFRTNTTDDASTLYQDDGFLTPYVNPDHRSEFFSGFVAVSGSALDSVDLILGAEVTGYSGLTLGDVFYINGTSGEISSVSGANSTRAGEPASATVLVADQRKFLMHPNIDIKPNSLDDTENWSEPVLVDALNPNDVTLKDMAVSPDGNYKLFAQVSEKTGAMLSVSYKVGSGPERRIDEKWATVLVGGWDDGVGQPDYVKDSPVADIDNTGKVFIGFVHKDGGGNREVRGVYGTITADEELSLSLSDSSAHGAGTISDPAAGQSRTALQVVRSPNGNIYLAALTTSSTMDIYKSTDDGANFAGRENPKSGATTTSQKLTNVHNFAPYKLSAIDDPDTPGDDLVSVVYSSNDAGNRRLRHAYTKDQNLANNWATEQVLPDTNAETKWQVIVGAHLRLKKLFLSVQSGTTTQADDGSTAIVNSTATRTKHIHMIDLGNPTTPAISDFEINYDAHLGTGQYLSFYAEGLDNTQHSLGRNYAKMKHSIYAISATEIIFSCEFNNGYHVWTHVPDTGTPVPNHIITNTSSDNNLYFATQFGSNGSDVFGVYKLIENSFAHNGLGRILTQKLLFPALGPELLTNGDFPTDFTGWNKTENGTSSVTIVSGEVNVVQDGGGSGFIEQDFVTEPGKFYKAESDAISLSGTMDHHIAVRDGSYVAPGENLYAQTHTTTGLKRVFFQAKSTTTNIFLGASSGGKSGTLKFDDASIKLSEFQFSGTPEDIIKKPNVDDEGYAGNMIVVSSEGAGEIHVLSEKEVTVDETDDIQQAVYNNYGLRTELFANTWKKQPKQTRNKTADEPAWDVRFDPDFPLFGVRVGIVGPTTDASYEFETTVDGGDNWFPGTSPDWFTVGTSHTASDQYWYTVPPRVRIKNKKVVIWFHKNDASTPRMQAAYGTLLDTGSLTLSESNTGSSLHAGNVFTNHPVSWVEDTLNSRIYAVFVESISNNIVIVVSEDDGVTFSNKPGGAAGTSSSVKDGATAAVAQSDAPISLIVTEDPDVAGATRLGVTSTEAVGSYNLKHHWIDAVDFSGNWETALSVSDIGTSTVRDFIFRVKLSDNGSKLAVVSATEAVNPGYLYLTIITLNTPTPSVGGAPVNIRTSWHETLNGIDYYNGNTSAATNGSFHRRFINNMIWTSTQSIGFPHSQVNGGVDAAALHWIKVWDVSNIAASFDYTVVKVGDASNRFTESWVESVGGVTWLGWIHKNTAPVSWLANGQAKVVRLYDTTPTASNDPIFDAEETDIANKPSFTNFLGHPIVQSFSDRLYTTFEKEDSTTGFDEVVVNSYTEREFNPTNEQFFEVPPKVWDKATDAEVWHWDENDNYVVTIAERATEARYYVTLYNKSTGVTTDVYNFGQTSAVTDYHVYGPKITIDSSNKVVAAYPNYDGANWRIDVNYGTIDAGGNLSMTGVIAIPDAGQDYTAVELVQRGTKHFIFAINVTTAKGYTTVSSDSGASWSTPAVVKTGGTDAALLSTSPYIFHVGDNGAAGDRMMIIGCDNGPSPTAMHMWYTNDDAVTWQTRIQIANANSTLQDVPIGYAVNGNKIAVVSYNDAVITQINLSTCSDLTVATPVFTAIADIGDGVNQIDKFAGHSSSSGTQRFGRRSLHKIIWTSATSLYVIYDRQGADGYPDQVVAKIPDISTPLTGKTVTTLFDGASPNLFYQESQGLKSPNGDVFSITKQGDSSGASNLTKGRILGVQLHDATPQASNPPTAGEVIDYNFKPDVITGGPAMRVQVQPGKGFMNEKDDGGSVESLYYQNTQAK